MAFIGIKDLTIGYEGSSQLVFDHVTLNMDTSWKLGLVGRNGKGKTTLLRLLLGELDYRGKITMPLGVRYFPATVSNKDCTLTELAAELASDTEEWKIRRELGLMNFENVDFERKFHTYSLGEQTKILLAVFFSLEDTFLLIDEPTNHLDRAGRAALSRYLSAKSSYILVSHDRSFLDGCIDHVMSINKSTIEISAGNFSTYLRDKAHRDERERNENVRLKTEVAQLRESSKRASDWAQAAEKDKHSGTDNKSGLRPDRGYIGAKAAKLMKRATAIKKRAESAIERKSELLHDIDRDDDLFVEQLDFYAERLLSVREFAASYDGNSVNAPLSFDVIQGDKICLVGANGSGKTSLLKAILGLNVSFSGEIVKPCQLKISYVAQDTSALQGTFDEFCALRCLDRTKLRILLDKLGFESRYYEQLLQCYSEGERKKLAIAASLSESAHLYLWDEPLNYIDIPSRGQLQRLLQDERMTVIFVEHDAAFCDAVATRKIAMG